MPRTRPGGERGENAHHDLTSEWGRGFGDDPSHGGDYTKGTSDNPKSGPSERGYIKTEDIPSAETADDDGADDDTRGPGVVDNTPDKDDEIGKEWRKIPAVAGEGKTVSSDQKLSGFDQDMVLRLGMDEFEGKYLETVREKPDTGAEQDSAIGNPPDYSGERIGMRKLVGHTHSGEARQPHDKGHGETGKRAKGIGQKDTVRKIQKRLAGEDEKAA